jgi:hypothetical protein
MTHVIKVDLSPSNLKYRAYSNFKFPFFDCLIRQFKYSNYYYYLNHSYISLKAIAAVEKNKKNQEMMITKGMVMQPTIKSD